MCDYLINVSLLRDFTSTYHGDQQCHEGREYIRVDHQGVSSTWPRTWHIAGAKEIWMSD